MEELCRTAKVTLVEDHLLYAEALAMALGAEGHVVERVTVPTDGAQARDVCAAILATQPMVVLLDLDLGRGLDGMSVIGPLQRAGAAVVVVTSSRDKARWGECLWHGARTVLSKSTALNTILETVGWVATNRPVLDPKDAAGLLSRYREESDHRQELSARLGTLTPREQEVLASLIRGRHVVEIARAKCVAESTVRAQVRSILLKLQVSSQLAAVSAALRAHWVEPLPA